MWIFEFEKDVEHSIHAIYKFGHEEIWQEENVRSRNDGNYFRLKNNYSLHVNNGIKSKTYFLMPPVKIIFKAVSISSTLYIF